MPWEKVARQGKARLGTSQSHPVSAAGHSPPVFYAPANTTHPLAWLSYCIKSQLNGQAKPLH